MATSPEKSHAPSTGCNCTTDPFADLPPELRPAAKPALGTLRQVICPDCGLTFWTNRSTDLCVACDKKQLKPKLSKERTSTMLTIKVLGPGCRNCETLAKKAAEALQAVAAETTAVVDTKIEKVTDHNKFVDYGLMLTPGLVINEKLVSSGRIPTVSEIKKWIADAWN